jgi:protein-S-isoprenylcysteine O-methyltransferase Ste14
MAVPLSDPQLFAAGTTALLWASRKPLRHPGSHGYYRFFAWEAILAVVVVNRNLDGGLVTEWIAQALLIVSVALLALGYGALLKRGRSAAATRSEGDDSALYGWERTTTLITHGIYRLIRHPMYASLLALDWGMFFRTASLMGFVPAALATFFLVRTADADERECLAYFGDAYRDYMQRTRRFIPFIY